VDFDDPCEHPLPSGPAHPIRKNNRTYPNSQLSDPFERLRLSQRRSRRRPPAV
jgi:hypothetical protein